MSPLVSVMTGLRHPGAAIARGADHRSSRSLLPLRDWLAALKSSSDVTYFSFSSRMMVSNLSVVPSIAWGLSKAAPRRFEPGRQLVMVESSVTPFLG